jgi:hypothetical protein
MGHGALGIGEAVRCGGQLRGRVSRLEQTVRWGSPRCSNCRHWVTTRVTPTVSPRLYVLHPAGSRLCVYISLISLIPSLPSRLLYCQPVLVLGSRIKSTYPNLISSTFEVFVFNTGIFTLTCIITTANCCVVWAFD